MQTSSQPKLLPVPFADAGSKQNIPNDSQIGITAGRASYTDGFPPLTRTPLAAGGVPPFGTDFNGVLNDITAALRWSQSGAGYPFNAAFNTAISGYPKGARIPNSTLDGYWLNTIEGNQNNPETTGSSAGWVPLGSYGDTFINGLSGSSITLTPLQASKDRIVLSGTLTANINVIVPAWIKRWYVVNNCTGNFSVTFKTPNGSGVVVPNGDVSRVYGGGTNISQDFGSAASRSVGTGSGQLPDMSSFASQQAASGYQQLPGGLVLQWINTTAPDGVTTGSVALPIAFNNQTLIAFVCDSITTGAPSNFNLAWSINTTTRSSISWVSTAAGVGAFTVLAIGR